MRTTSNSLGKNQYTSAHVHVNLSILELHRFRIPLDSQRQRLSIKLIGSLYIAAGIASIGTNARMQCKFIFPGEREGHRCV